MKKYRRYFPTILCMGYYAAVCVSTGRVGGAQILWLALALFFAVFSHLRHREKCRKANEANRRIDSGGSCGSSGGDRSDRRARVERLALRVCTVLLIAGVVCGAAAEGMILSAMSHQPEADVDYVIVLGAKVNKTTPSLSLRYRINSAAEYLKENPRSKVVVSGGQGADEDISEAEAMARSLEAQGIDSGRILLEDKSTSTEENLRFSMALIESDGGSADSTVAIVTSDFHVFRALRLAERTGYRSVSGCAAPSMGALIPQNHMREILAVSYYFVTGAL